MGRNHHGGYVVHRCRDFPEDEFLATKCKYCRSEEVLWVKQPDPHLGYRFQLLETYGLPHVCEEFVQINQAHREALREDYKFEKKWVNSFADDHKCKSCKGVGSKQYKRKTNRNGYVVRTCKKCKGIGNFNPAGKKQYLKKLRSKYWPYMSWHMR